MLVASRFVLLSDEEVKNAWFQKDHSLWEKIESDANTH